MGYLEVNIFGLVLDLAGVALIFRFAVVPQMNAKGTIYLAIEGRDMDEVKRFWRYSGLGDLGFYLILIGFLLQIFSGLMQGAFGCLPPFCT